MLKKEGIPVEERRLSVEELAQAMADGSLEEAFGCGTAAVVSPIGELCYKDQVYIVNEGKIGKLTQHLYDTLTGIQWGRIEDPNNMHLGHFSDKIANNTCIFLISVSGQSTEIIARVRNYHTSGCKVITLTSDQDSPLAKAADVCIAYELPLIMTEEDNMTSHVPAGYIIETLNRMVSEIKRNQ
jgi:DNA-binding MurR/RpiR family transcriptional regulator